MRKLTKKKYILASNGDCDLKNENKVARGTFFLDFYFSIGGSVHAELVAYRKEKETADRLKLEQLQESIKADSNNQSLDEMKKMNVSPEAIQKVETSLQEEAKSKVTEIQGQYYETYD